MIIGEGQGRIAAAALRMAGAARCEVAAMVPVRGNRHGVPLAVGFGGPTHVSASPQTVLRAALMSNADAFVLLHTHLDDMPPSNADLAVTRRLVAGGELLGVPMLGHLVVSPSAWYDCCREQPSTPFAYVVR